MAWVKLDDQWMEHPKIIQAGRDARDVWLASITWCAKYLTDGQFSESLLPSLLAIAGVDVANSKQIATKLLSVGLWDATANGYAVHDYLVYNPSKKEVLELREARKDAGSAGGKAKAGRYGKSLASATAKDIAKDYQNPAPSPSPSPSPIPGPAEEEGAPRPAAAPAQPPSTSPSIQAERTWQIVTGQTTIPSTIRNDACAMIDGLSMRYKWGKELTAYLSKYWEAWIAHKTRDGRPYSRTSAAWLEWAISGQIPPENGGKPHVETLEEVVNRIKREEAAANGNA